MMSTDSTQEQRKDRRRTHFRRLPAIFRTMPPMNFGSRMHTIRTRMCSPPASRNQRPAGANQRRARQRTPGPSRDAQKQQQQSRADEHASQKLPQPILRRTMGSPAVHRPVPDFSHAPFPRFTARLCAATSANAGFSLKKFVMMTNLLHLSFTRRRKSCKIEGGFVYPAEFRLLPYRTHRRTPCLR